MTKDTIRALRKTEQGIEQLCSTINVLAGFRKVRAEDFTEELRAILRDASHA